MGHKDSPRIPATAGGRLSVQALRTRRHAQVLIIGGGIIGVGTFRDPALQGVDVALVERGNYCRGASGASSHMIHGGSRYLDNGEFRPVRESVVERNRPLRIAPHYVKPPQTTIPIFGTFSGVLAAPLGILTRGQQGRPRERDPFLIKPGLGLYDAFSRDGGSLPRHRFRGRRRALAELPRLHPGIKYTATYFDASVHNPERLTLDVLQGGEKAGAADGRARAGNHVSPVGGTGLTSTDSGSGSGSAVRLRDGLSGEESDFTADVIVNATGARVDVANRAPGKASAFMGGTKGSHIVLDHPELSVRELEFMARREQVGHLVDVLVRRTSLAFRGLVTGELLIEVAEILPNPLGWDQAAKAAEISDAQEVLRRLHRVRVHSLVT